MPQKKKNEHDKFLKLLIRFQITKLIKKVAWLVICFTKTLKDKSKLLSVFTEI